MKGKLKAAVCATLLGASGFTSAQVYESHDAEGNPVFSDRPSQGAEEISIQDTNVSDPVQEESAGAQASGPSPTASEVGQPRQVVIMGEDEDRQRHNEAIDNEGRREVLDAERRTEVLEAEPRHEVR